MGLVLIKLFYCKLLQITCCLLNACICYCYNVVAIQPIAIYNNFDRRTLLIKQTRRFYCIHIAIDLLITSTIACKFVLTCALQHAVSVSTRFFQLATVVFETLHGGNLIWKGLR